MIADFGGKVDKRDPFENLPENSCLCFDMVVWRYFHWVSFNIKVNVKKKIFSLDKTIQFDKTIHLYSAIDSFYFNL